jgi:hypothetical protein
MMNFASRSLMKRHDVCALSGKSTKAQYATMPKKQVNAPSIMKIHLQLLEMSVAYQTWMEGESEPIEALSALQLHQAVGQDTSAGRSQTTEDVEDGVSFANVETSVPRREQIDTRWEETRFKYTQKNAHGSHGLKGVNKAHADHDSTPGHDDEGQKFARSKISHNYRGRRLEYNVCGEEDERYDRVFRDSTHEFVQAQVYVHAGGGLARCYPRGTLWRQTQQWTPSSSWFDPSN